MTLAESIIDHCRSPREGTYGGIMGQTIPLKTLLANIVQQRIRVSDGVELTIPSGCTWQASDQADGGVQIAFNGELPNLFVRKGPISVNPEITSVVLRIGKAAVEIQASSRLAHVPMPPYTVTIPL